MKRIKELEQIYRQYPTLFQPTAFFKVPKMIRSMGLDTLINDKEVIIKNDLILHTYFSHEKKKLDISNYDIAILNERIDFFSSREIIIEQYFKLSHDLQVINHTLCDDIIFKNVDFDSELALVVEVINDCYDDISVNQALVKSWTTEAQFSPDLWIWAIDKAKKIVGLGIAEIDLTIKEGSLEWIQVKSEFQKRGYGSLIVNKLLNVLKSKVDFVTVSGKVKTASFYQNCGFTNKVIWNIIKSEVKI